MTTIKLEAGNQEPVTEIQTYLESFNKDLEVGHGDQMHVQLQQVEGLEGEDGGTYFVDQSGQYYYQASNTDTPVLTQVQIQEVNTDQLQAAELGGIGTDELKTQVSVVSDSDSGANVVKVNDEEAYQTLTLVPSSNGQGEVSYVLIVQQPDKTGAGPKATMAKIQQQQDGDNEQDQDLAVYDFEDNEENDAAVESEVEDDKTKIVKFIPKKSQTVTQAHMCNYCNYTSPKRYLLSRHMKSHSEERPHKCSVCERGFKTLASLQNHVNTHTGTKPHHCKFCDSAFTTSGELVRHVRYRHTHEKPHKCHECDYASVELSKLKRHIRCHTGERPYQCPHCTYASPDTFKLKRHLRIHTGEKPYECDICNARFTQSNSLKAHKLVHNVGDKPVFQCELCPTTCGRKTDLRIHVQKLHTSDKPLKCKRCNKTFPDRYSYKLHNKTHEGEKCYKCDLCPYASISARHLESHMLIHTDQKPYQCDHCFQSFRQKQLLKRHCNLYHNPSYVPPPPQEKIHQCPECERSFRHKGNLIRHMAVHDPESSVQEKQKALKVGRQKKIQIIDGQRIEVMTGELDGVMKDDLDDEEEEEEEEEIEEEEEEDGEDVMAVEGSDGQQYVVLEVIQLPDGKGGTEQMMVKDLGSLQDPLEADGDDEDVMMEEDEEGELITDRIKDQSMVTTKEISLKKDMETCFGFDEVDDEELEESGDITMLREISEQNL